MTTIKQVYTVQGPDGQSRNFDSMAEAKDFLRRPIITKAFMALTGDNAELSAWLIEHQDTIENAFDTGTIRRVTKAEKNKLAKELDLLVEAHKSGAIKVPFLAEQAEGLKTSFKYPPIPRMTDEEKAIATKNTLLALDPNEGLADWLIENRDAILAGYEAGVVKQPVNAKAQVALGEYRVKVAREKLEKLKAEGASAEAIAEQEAKLAATIAGAPAAPPAPAGETEAADDAGGEGEEQAPE